MSAESVARWCRNMTDEFVTDPPRLVAYGRPETDPCERGTVGCCISHTTTKEVGCEPW